MTILRGLVAIAVGLAIGAMAAFLAMVGGDLLQPSSLRLIPFVLIAGILLSTPGWGLSCLIVLPVVTHRARIRGFPPSIPYLAGAAAIGAAAGLPTLLILGASHVRILTIVSTGGVVGGLAIASMWRWLILNPIAARRDVTNGAFLG